MATKTDTSEADAEAEAKAAETEALKEQIVELREAGGKWEEIAAEVGIAPNRAMFLYLQTTIKPKDRIKTNDPEALAAAVVEARDEEKQSWGTIMARTGLGESKLRSIYEKETGNSTKGNRIGKGGRYPSGVTPPPKPEKAKKEPAAKKAPAKKAANKYVGMDYEALQEALAGKTVTYKHAGKQLRTKVADVADLTGEGADAEVTIENPDGNTAIIKVAAIVRVAAR